MDPVHLEKENEKTAMQTEAYNILVALRQEKARIERARAGQQEVAHQKSASNEDYKQALQHYKKDLQPRAKKPLESYMTFQTMIGDVLQISEALFTIYSEDLNEQFNIPGIREQLYRPVKEHLLGAFNFLVSKEEEVILPVLAHMANVDENGKLQNRLLSFVESDLFADNPEKRAGLTEKINNIRRMHTEKVGEWLTQQGYAYKTDAQGQNTDVIVDTAHPTAPFDREKFIARRDDPKNGLNAFLETQFKMQFEQQEEHHSAPSLRP